MENKQLTARPPKHLPATAKTGVSEISFARLVPTFKTIRELKVDDPSRLEDLQDVFAEAALLIGIKDPISKPNKADVAKLILKRFTGLSIEEVREAFEMDRFGVFGDPTPSFQLFNSEFVSQILTRYKNWLRQTRHENNLPMRNTPENSSQELSEEEKAQLIINGVRACFNEYKESGVVDPGRLYAYEFLYNRKLLPKHTPEFRDRIEDKAKRQALRETESKRKASVGVDRANLKRKIDEIKAGNYQLKTIGRTIILKEYFDQLIAEEKDINELI